MPERRIQKLRYDSWSRYTVWQGASYEILPTFTHMRLQGESARLIASRVEAATCPTCESELRLEIRNPGIPPDETGSRTHYHLCDSCGFWKFGFRDNVFLPYSTIPHAKRFDHETEVPSLSHLAREIRSHREKIYTMKPTAFEVFVGSVLSDYLDCEVHHVGRSGDDGIDLVALVSDSPMMIQVKRRRDPSATEGIDVVKLLFASAFGRGADKGMVVTSAKRFSRPAKTWCASRRLVDVGFRFDLVDMNSLMSMVDAVASSDDEPGWLQHRNRPNTQRRTSPARELLHFSDFDVVVPDDPNDPVLAFEHADLTKIHVVDQNEDRSLLRNPELRFREFRERWSNSRTLCDEAAVHTAESLPVGILDALAKRWEREFPEAIHIE